MKVIEDVKSNIKPEYVSCDNYHVYVATDILEKQVNHSFDMGDESSLRTEYTYNIHEYTREEFDRLVMNDKVNIDSTLIDHDYRMCLIELGLN